MTVLNFEPLGICDSKYAVLSYGVLYRAGNFTYCNRGIVMKKFFTLLYRRRKVTRPCRKRNYMHRRFFFASVPIFSVEFIPYCKKQCMHLPHKKLHSQTNFFVTFFKGVIPVSGSTRAAAPRDQKAPEPILRVGVLEHKQSGNDRIPHLSPIGLVIGASQVSGYTLIGMSGDAYRNGFGAYMWLPASLVLASSLVAVAPRMQYLGKMHSYVSPLDFLRHRYPEARLLWALCFVCMCVPNAAYILAQCKGMGEFVAGLTGGTIPPFWGALGLGVVVLVYEALGGMESVVWTDVIQVWAASVRPSVASGIPCSVAVVPCAEKVVFCVLLDPLRPSAPSSYGQRGCLIELEPEFISA